MTLSLEDFLSVAFDNFLTHLRMLVSGMVLRPNARPDRQHEEMLREKFQQAVVEAVAEDIKAGGKLHALALEELRYEPPPGGYPEYSAESGGRPTNTGGGT